MSLGQPDLYIGSTRMQSTKNDPRPALAGLKLEWGEGSRTELAPPAKLSGQILIRGAMPSYLNVGAPVGLIDPASSRCLFAGRMAPLTAVNEDSVKGARRVTFTAASPVSEISQHTAVDVNYPQSEAADTRLARIRAAMPAGWELSGAAGWDWAPQGRQAYQSVLWLDLLARYVRGNLQRFDDTSTYIPGAGLQKRLTISAERPKSVEVLTTTTGARGIWHPNALFGASGAAVLPASVVRRTVQWSKTPADLVTAIQGTTWGKELTGGETESPEHEYPLDFVRDTAAMIRSYGYHPLRIETALSPQNVPAMVAALGRIYDYWLDGQSNWRPTSLMLPDSRRLDTAPLLNLLAVDTRARAVVSVPDAPADSPAPIRSPVMAAAATWTGTKWETELTLGRTL